MDSRTRQLTAVTKLLTRLMVIALLAGTAFLAVSRESKACSYAAPGSPSDERRKAKYVFAGEVVAVHPVKNDKIYEFTVDTVWKGPLHETAYIRGYEEADAKSLCPSGYKPYAVGLKYLVYDSYHKFSRTRLLIYASEDIAELGQGRRPEPGLTAPVPLAVTQAQMAPQEILTETPTIDRLIGFLVWTLASVSVVAIAGLLIWTRFGRRR